MRAGALLSPCETYRYRLTRDWGTEPRAVFIMLNPSTADAAKDDPTIVRCTRFAQAWGCGGLLVLNVYAFRATDPRELAGAPDPVGAENDDHLWGALRAAGRIGNPVVAAWGVHADVERVSEVLTIAESAGVTLTALGVTKGGQPRHPLYMPKTATPSPWPAREQVAA